MARVTARTKRFFTVAAAAAAASLAMRVSSAPAADGSPSPGPARLQSTAAQRAAASAPVILSTQPKRTVRIPGQIAAPSAPAMQDVVVPVKPGALVSSSRLRMDCTAHDLEVARITGTVTPGGAITIRGRCFGKPGSVQMGIASYGADTMLTVTSWTDDTVLASVPPLRGIVDQPVRIRLARGTARLSKQDGGAVAVFSEPITMMFTAARETTYLWGAYIAPSCSRTGVALEDSCIPCADGDSTQPQNFAYHYGEHWRTMPASGVDTWRATLPGGWRFDRIEYQSFPVADIVVDPPGADPSIVQWRVRWQTMHSSGERPDYEGTHQHLDDRERSFYGGLVYVTGPAGTLHGRYSQNAQQMCY
jgi:hypothetical protein